ncbi:uncharacterized protein LOC127746607 [Arachis duranensis]|uniref:Uncharacterized protein LOC127746607 n=1 Tax=Arachis duranensis TaxID=130453 RepID=A0A9C6TX89_ARADU|nr:uncharacterized protein LOC127746607 [Arachis duranensis]
MFFSRFCSAESKSNTKLDKKVQFYSKVKDAVACLSAQKSITKAHFLGLKRNLIPQATPISFVELILTIIKFLSGNDRTKGLPLPFAGLSFYFSFVVMLFYFYFFLFCLPFWLNAMKNNEVLAEEGAVGLAIWVPSVTNRKKEIDNKSDTRNSPKGYSPVSPADENEDNWRQANAADGLELSVVSDAADHEAIDKKLHLKNLKVSQAMSDSYLKVSSSATLKDAIQCIHDGYQNCVLVVNQEGFLEGILTYGDIRRCLPEKSSDTSMRDSGFVDCDLAKWVSENIRILCGDEVEEGMENGVRGNGEKLAMNDGNYEGGTLVLTVCGFGFDDSNEKGRKHQRHGFKTHQIMKQLLIARRRLTATLEARRRQAPGPAASVASDEERNEGARLCARR